MLSEKLKFIEKAAETSYEEIVEEVESLYEGADLKTSGELIKSILKDLLNTIKNVDSVVEEEMCDEVSDEEIQVRTEDFTLDDGERIFMPGEKVIIKHRIFAMNVHDAYFEALNIPRSLEFKDWDKSVLYDIVTILKVAKFPDVSMPLYAVSSKNGRFFIFQKGLEEIDG